MDSANRQFTVVISDVAAHMLMQHVRFMAEVSGQAAEKLRGEIIAAVKSLENFPARNAWLADPLLPANKYRKMVINKRYLLIYQIKSDEVLVECILDCRQEYKWLI